MIEDGAARPDTGETVWRSLLRATLALLATLALVVAGLHVTYREHAGTAEVFARLALFPLLALAGVSWLAGVWRTRTHAIAQAVLVMLGIGVMPFAAFLYEIMLECGFLDSCS